MIISCGEALVDLVPEATPGGGPMNVAIAAARLGVPSAFLGCVSTDDYGEQIWEHLTSNNVDVAACQRSEAPTARAIVEHVPQLVFRFEGSETADTKLRQPDLSPLGTGPHIVHGGTLGLFRGETAETLAAMVESHDGLISLDPNIRPQIIDDRDRWTHFHERWLAHTDLYKGSDEDLDWIWPDRSPDDTADALLSDGIAVVIVTRGGDGLTIITADGEFPAAAPEVDVVDTVGAGDTIVGTVLASLWERDVHARGDLSSLSGSDWTEIAERAVAAAAITCSRPGADPPRRAELAW
ncbi:MAG: carbohydrate kinase family protein [Acidimicrobiales bacterium]